MNNREAFEVMRRDKIEELLDEYFDLAVEKGRNFERNGLRSNQVRKEILSLFDLASQAQQPTQEPVIREEAKEEFETWCWNPSANSVNFDTSKNDAGEYVDMQTNGAYQAWSYLKAQHLSCNPVQVQSQAQQPTQEPAAWLAPTEDERWNVIAPKHKENLSKTESHDNYEKEYAARFTVPLYLQSQAQQTESRWISVEGRLPEVKKGGYQNVIVSKINADGKKYVFEASYLNELELQFDESDEYRSFSGWYIQVEKDGDDHFDAIQYGTVTDWMPLPPAPEGGDK